MKGNFHVRFGERGGETRWLQNRRVRSAPTLRSGGMFVQSDLFTHHSGELAFFGQESKDFTYRLARMNLFIHGINGNIKLGNSYTDDKHEALRADYILANPPFNDGAKGENGWGASNISNRARV